MLSAIFGWFNGSPSILCILVSKFNLRNIRSIVDVNSLCEIVSHCRTPLSCRLSCSILNALSTCCLFKCISAVPYRHCYSFRKSVSSPLSEVDLRT